jgi:hypothetical protein
MAFDMKLLLIAVRDRLKSQVTALGNRVWVVADESLLPIEAAFPAATVKDGGTVPLVTDVQETLVEHTVIVSVFQENLRDVEAAVIGDAAATPNVQDLIGSVITALKDQTLSLQMLSIVRPSQIGGTDLYLDPGAQKEVVKKSITWAYQQKPSI